VSATATSALVALVALAAGCEIVGGIKRRPLAGGGSGGSAAGMTAGTGGAAGRGGDGGGAGAGGSIGGAGGKQTRIGTSCPTLGEFDCDAPMSRTTLACGVDNRWTTGTNCPLGQLCDSRPGDTHGTCLAVLPECADQSPQDHVCIGGELHACGPDLVTSDFIDGCSTAVGECARCKPVMIAGGPGRQAQPAGIAIDAAYVYWRVKDSSGRLGIARSPLDGNGVTTFLGGDLGSGYIAIQGANLYGLVMGPTTGPAAVPTEGGSAVALDTSGTAYDVVVGCIAVDANNAYWSPGSTGYLGGAVFSVALTGGTSAPLAMNQAMVLAITVDASNVYWTSTNGNVVKAPINGGSVDELATGQQNPNAIAVNDGVIYWSNGAGTVSSVAVTGGTVTTLAIGPNGNPSLHYNGLGIAVDTTTVYWADPTNNKIMRVRKNGGAPVTVAGAALPLGLVIDDTHIYWANGSSYTIMRIAK